jgi:hypothetical protein
MGAGGRLAAAGRSRRVRARRRSGGRCAVDVEAELGVGHRPHRAGLALDLSSRNRGVASATLLLRRRPGDPREAADAPAGPPVALRRSAPRPARAVLCLFEQPPQDVVVYRQLADLSLRGGEPAVLLGLRAGLQALTPGGEELLSPAAYLASRLAGLAGERVKRLATQESQDDPLPFASPTSAARGSPSALRSLRCPAPCLLPSGPPS